MRLFPLSLLLLVSCSGTDEDTFTRPENCEDGVDNNDNGLVDCDDSAFCGGLQCDENTNGGDTDVPLPDLEIGFDATECCDFQWQAGDCPKSIGTFGISNRSTELDAVVDVSCDLVSNESVISWQIQGTASPMAFIVDEPLYTESSMTVEGFFNCGANNAFTTQCRIHVENDQMDIEHEFEISGEPVAGP